MKTAIIKTDFWKEDKIFNLLPDARYFYLCLLTNPERGTLPAFKCSDRLMVAYTGYNAETIKLCKSQLIEAGLIQIIDNFYVINDEDYVKPTKGKLTQKLQEKELNSLPLNVKNSLRSGSGAAQEYNNNNKNNDNNNDKNINNSLSKTQPKIIEKNKSTESIQAARLLYDLIIERDPRLQHKLRKYENWAYDIDKLNRIDGYSWGEIQDVITWCQNNSFWRSNINSGSKLRKQFPTLLDQSQNRTSERIGLVW